MDKESTQELTQKAVETVQRFFADHLEDQQAVFPEALQSSGIWMAMCLEQVLAIFFLNDKEQQRINACKHKGRHPFPEFVIGEGARPAGRRATFHVTGPFGFYASRRTSNMFAFALGPGSSCTVEEHVHEVVDTSENKVAYTYKVDLAFMLGLDEGERSIEVGIRLAKLLSHTLEVWKTVHP
jgi:hypothetical protein